MSFFDEIPMNSPHPRAKLYRGFAFSKKNIRNELELTEYLSNHVTRSDIKWNFETGIKKGIYKVTSTFVYNGVDFFIGTNSVEEIEIGDIVSLKWRGFKSGEDKFVVEGLEKEYISCPNLRLKRQHLKLKHHSKFNRGD